jgi:hypothetical protein
MRWRDLAIVAGLFLFSISLVILAIIGVEDLARLATGSGCSW